MEQEKLAQKPDCLAATRLRAYAQLEQWSDAVGGVKMSKKQSDAHILHWPHLRV